MFSVSSTYILHLSLGLAQNFNNLGFWLLSADKHLVSFPKPKKTDLLYKKIKNMPPLAFVTPIFKILF